MKRLARGLSSLFTSCLTGTRRHGTHGRLNNETFEEEEVYILPGEHLVCDAGTGNNRNKREYVPPEIPQSSLRTSHVPSAEDFKLLKTLGKGAFGKVLLVAHKPTRILYAMKVLPKTKCTSRKQLRQVLTEMDILRNVKHPFCVVLQFAFQNSEFLFYIFEFAAGGMLFYHLKEEGRFSEQRARFYIGEIILALEYLHSLSIIFRDLKPENCLLSAAGHIVLSDFGSARKLLEGERTSTLAGTPHYMAPEVLKGEPYTHSSDWWSCGILLFEMMTGKPPFESQDRMELYRSILGGYFKVPLYVSGRARSLLYELIETDPNLRLKKYNADSDGTDASRIRQHPFFSQLPMDTEEENRYAVEESKRQEVYNSISSVTGSVVQDHFSLRPTVACEWEWNELLSCRVTPPFIPKIVHPTNCRYFDPVATTINPSLMDLPKSNDHFYVDDFDFKRCDS